MELLHLLHLRTTLRSVKGPSKPITANWDGVCEFSRSVSGSLGGFEKIVSLIEKEPLKFVPGESFAYSNTNYIALGRVVEVVSGESYRRYIQRHLFDPAGMSQSTTIAEENAVENMAIGFASDSNEPEHIVPALRFNPGLAWSAGYIVSTVGDLEKWDTALRNGRIISPADWRRSTQFSDFGQDNRWETEGTFHFYFI